MVVLPVIQRLFNLHVLWSDLALADMSSRKADLSSLTGEGRSLQSVNYLKEPCRRLTSYSDLHRSIVIIYVSPEQYPFHLHKDRLCQQSLGKFKLFKECFYSEKLSDPRGSVNPSLLLVNVFCFAEKVGISKLQMLRSMPSMTELTGKDSTEAAPDTTDEIFVKPQSLFACHPSPTFEEMYLTTMTNSGFEKAAEKYLPSATFSAIHYAYHHSPESVPVI